MPKSLFNIASADHYVPIKAMHMNYQRKSHNYFSVKEYPLV